MNAGACCGIHGVPEERTIHRVGPPLSVFRRRFFNTSGWLMPAAILAIVPKCPACLAVYLAFATGFGISVSTAAYARTLIVTLCVAALVYFAVKHVRRAAHLKTPDESSLGTFAG